MIRSQKKFGEILVEKGLITVEQLEEALQEQVRTKEFLGRILVKNKVIREEDLLSTLSVQFNIPVMSMKDRYIDWDFVSEFSASLIFDYGCFPIQSDEWTVTFAITNPLDVWALKEAEQSTRGLRLKFVLVNEDDFKMLIQRYQQYRRGNLPRLFE